MVSILFLALAKAGNVGFHFFWLHLYSTSNLILAVSNRSNCTWSLIIAGYLLAYVQDFANIVYKLCIRYLSIKSLVTFNLLNINNMHDSLYINLLSI